MTSTAQKELRTKYYSEAMRYMDNAKATLKHADKHGEFYRDPKYVRTACGTAYNGVLIALDGYLEIKEIRVPKAKNRKDKQYYEMAITKLDKKLLNYFHSAYNILHLDGYYDGILNVTMINEGLRVAYTIIEKIKPLT